LKCYSKPYRQSVQQLQRYRLTEQIVRRYTQAAQEGNYAPDDNTLHELSLENRESRTSDAKKEEFFLHEFYKWLIKIDSSDATKIFCGVHNDVDLVKAKSKKRKANSRKEYYEQSIQVHYNSVTAQGKIEPITQVGSPPIN
tara:strand:- start:1 stop:423 length:423 start_codon:yes stop_codon:yes gene_type:complete